MSEPTTLQAVIERLESSETPCTTKDVVNIDNVLYTCEAQVRWWNAWFSRKRGHTISITLDHEEKY